MEDKIQNQMIPGTVVLYQRKEPHVKLFQDRAVGIIQRLWNFRTQLIHSNLEETCLTDRTRLCQKEKYTTAHLRGLQAHGGLLDQSLGPG